MISLGFGALGIHRLADRVGGIRPAERSRGPAVDDDARLPLQRGPLLARRRRRGVGVIARVATACDHRDLHDGEVVERHHHHLEARRLRLLDGRSAHSRAALVGHLERVGGRRGDAGNARAAADLVGDHVEARLAQRGHRQNRHGVRIGEATEHRGAHDVRLADHDERDDAQERGRCHLRHDEHRPQGARPRSRGTETQRARGPDPREHRGRVRAGRERHADEHGGEQAPERRL